MLGFERIGERSYDTNTKEPAGASAPKRKRSANVKRTVQTPAEIVESVKKSPSNYKAQSDEVKKASLQNAIAVDLAIMKTAYHRGRVDLDNPEELKTQSEIFLQACQEAGVIPSFEKFCASLGYSRQTVYAYLRDNPQTQSASIIEYVRTVFTDLLQDQALQRNFAETLSIFLLKNARGQGYTDKPSEMIQAYREAPSIERIIEQMDLLVPDDGEGLPIE